MRTDQKDEDRTPLPRVDINYPIGHGKCPNDVANHSAVLLPDLANYSVSFKPYLARGLQHTPYLTAEIRQDRISQLRL